ncbi:MAG: nucleotidyltransferase domain-containing protein [Clostridia bacterium]|nr:nucleotidyltransferase domain-containing protein [Clostridia bacterium]
MDKIYTIEEIRSIVAPIAAAHAVERIYLFGSYARGEATATSDVDLRVDRGKIKGLIALGALYADLEDGLGKSLDLLTTGSLDQSFLQQIKDEEVLLYGVS